MTKYILKRLYENYFAHVDKAKYAPQGVTIFKNPSQTELEKYTSDGAKGYIDSNGNLYVEGYSEEQEGGGILHSTLLSIISRFGVPLTQEYIENFHRFSFFSEDGLTVEVFPDAKIYVGESPILDKNTPKQLSIIYERASKKNPLFTFIPSKITDPFYNLITGEGYHDGEDEEDLYDDEDEETTLNEDEEGMYNDEDENYGYEGEIPTHSIEEVKKHKIYLAKIAQDIYNDWDESDRDTYANGGICHLIADGLADYLNQLGIETATVSSSHEQHVYCVSKLIEGVYSIDIHWSYYETGGGFSWKKIPNVIFDGSELEFYRIDSDYKEWENQVESY